MSAEDYVDSLKHPLEGCYKFEYRNGDNWIIKGKIKYFRHVTRENKSMRCCSSLSNGRSSDKEAQTDGGQTGYKIYRFGLVYQLDVYIVREN